MSLISRNLVSLLLLVMAGCGFFESSDGAIGSASTSQNTDDSCISGLCIDLASASQLEVNYDIVELSGIGGERLMGKFNTTIGSTYVIHVDGNAGFEIALTDKPLFDPGFAVNEKSYGYGTHDAFEFQAKTETHYFLLVLGESQQSVEASVRIVSSEDNIVPQEDWDPPLAINALPTEFSMISGQITHGYFPVQEGNTYSILGRPTQGSIDVFTGEIPFPDDFVSDEQDLFGDDFITFQAKSTGYYFIGVKNTGDNGVDGTIQVISYDEALSPNGQETLLTVDGPEVGGTSLPGEVLRYRFVQQTAVDYQVSVTKDAGGMDAFLSVLPSVDDRIATLSDFFCQCTFSFRADQTGNLYLAVVDTTKTSGSTFYVSVSSN